MTFDPKPETELKKLGGCSAAKSYECFFGAIWEHSTHASPWDRNLRLGIPRNVYLLLWSTRNTLHKFSEANYECVLYRFEPSALLQYCIS